MVAAETTAVKVKTVLKPVDIRYVRLGTSDIDAAVRFATERVGLELVARGSDCAYLRGDDRDHSLCYFKGDSQDHTLAFEVATERDIETAAQTLTAHGLTVSRGTPAECAARRVMSLIGFRDPTGNKIELVARPFHSGRRYFPSRDAGIVEFSHVGLKTTDATRDQKFWTELFGFRSHDWLGPAALLSFDGVHHRIALFPTQAPGVQHMNFQVESVDDVFRSYYALSTSQTKIVFGPGRHPLSGASFLYFETPDQQMVFEYSFGMPDLDDTTYRPRQFPWEPLSLCMWGAKPDVAEFRSGMVGDDGIEPPTLSV